MTPGDQSARGLLHELPAPPPGRTGWPWTEETPPATEGSLLPRISVVTPSFNQAEYVEETIRSVLLQNYPNLEYFVMDGGSSDGTREILEKYSPWLTGWTCERDNGQTHALNKGFARATGEYYAYINSDDYYLPSALQQFARAFAQHPEAGIVNGICNYVNAVGAPIGKHQGDLSSFAEAINVWDYWWRGKQFIQPEVMWRAALHREIGGFREELYYAMDVDLWIRLFLAGAKAAPINAEICAFRVLEGQKSAAKEKLADEILRKVVEPVLSNPDAPIPEADRRWFRARWNYQCRFMHTLKESLAKNDGRFTRYQKLASVLVRHPGILAVPNCRRHVRAALFRKLIEGESA